MDFATELTRVNAVRSALITLFSENFANRFMKLLIGGASIGAAFTAHGFNELASHFSTVGRMIEYLISRRRHFVALLQALPELCRGNLIVQPMDTLNNFLPLIEMHALELVGAQQALLLNSSRELLGLDVGNSVGLAMLDPMFLEPERSRIIDMELTTAGIAMLATRETLASDRMFSAAELRNDILGIEAAYAEFNLAGTRFAAGARLVRRLSKEFIDRDFWVAIRPDELESLYRELDISSDLRGGMVHSEQSYRSCLHTYAPLVLLDGVYRSSVTLLSRFMYNWRAASLETNKRFQIRSGFTFEKAVAKALGQQGFEVQDITRINRQEFDVVTLRDGTIWNVQCKNNFLNLEILEADCVRFARYNRRLVRSYERALAKERNREQLLKSKLSIDNIQHMVLSRFPVVTDNLRIMPFSRINDFGATADSLAPLVS